MVLHFAVKLLHTVTHAEFVPLPSQLWMLSAPMSHTRNNSTLTTASWMLEPLPFCSRVGYYKQSVPVPV